ncbi:hypothetical protein HOD75_00840 [archaeon]|nr:hypothetical protein [archaeon]MBT4241423.1 hypothetical protein [archaeon]MBT4417706.1 hypothetical protein [archaeon]
MVKTNAYDEMRKDFAKVNFYDKIVQTVQQGGHFQELPQIASQAVADSALSDDDKKDLIARINSPDNQGNNYIMFPAVAMGLESAKKEFAGHKDNLEGIVKSAPDDRIARALEYVQPPKDYDGSYKALAELHADVNNVTQILGALNSDKVAPEQKKQILEGVMKEVAAQYQEAYKDNPELLSLIIEFLKHDDQLAVMKYQRGAKDKMENFEKAFKEKGRDYMVELVGEDNALGFYELLLKPDYEDQASTAA